jgi:hypothetical protein
MSKEKPNPRVEPSRPPEPSVRATVLYGLRYVQYLALNEDS